MDIEPMILGLLRQNAQSVDTSFSGEIRNHLFRDHSPKYNKEMGSDLVAINIQRGRDHGIPGYNKFREMCNLPILTSFSQNITEIPADIWATFRSLYADVNDIDLFPGAISEKPVDNDALLGPTFSCIIAKQFHNLKFGDRFFFTHRNRVEWFYNKQLNTMLEQLEMRRLSDIICDNTDLTEIQLDAMRVPDYTNPVIKCFPK